MSRKIALTDMNRRRNPNTTITDMTGVATIAKIISKDSQSEIAKNFTEIKNRLLTHGEELSELSGKSIDTITESLSMINPGEMICSIEELVSGTGETVKEINVLYDVSGSMFFARPNMSVPAYQTYINFHNKMGLIFKALESKGVTVKIFYFSNREVSRGLPLTPNEFCANPYIPGGGTYLSPAWNQLTNSSGTVLLITDGQFSDRIPDFNSLKFINNLVFCVPSWTTVSEIIIQQLRDKQGTIPLEFKPNCDSHYEQTELVDILYSCCIVMKTPYGFTRYGKTVFPSCWSKPSVTGKVVYNMIHNHPSSVPKVFEHMNEIFNRILCTMRIDFEGTLKSDDARNFLKTINVFRKSSDVEMSRLDSMREPEPEGEQTDQSIQPDNPQNNYQHFNDMFHTCDTIFNEGSNLKDNITKKLISSGLHTTIRFGEINQMWDECFSADETDDILAAHVNHTQTHTWIFHGGPMPYEIIRLLRASAHALDKLTLTCLLMYFTKGNFEIRAGVHTGDGCIPVFNNNPIDTIRLLPSHRFFSEGEAVSFTFSVTVALRIIVWLLANMSGPNQNLFQ
jgi:hypothetical protein